MNNKNLTIGLAITLIIAIIGVFTPVGKKVEQVVGTVTNGNWTSFSGLWIQSSSNQEEYGSQDSGAGGQNIRSVVRVPIVSGATISCSIPTPTATSSLIDFSLIPTTGTSTSVTLTLATSTTAFATTSIIANVTYTPNLSFTFDPSVNNSTIYPSTFINVGLNPGATESVTLQGYCTAEFLTQ